MTTGGSEPAWTDATLGFAGGAVVSKTLAIDNRIRALLFRNASQMIETWRLPLPDSPRHWTPTRSRRCSKRIVDLAVAAIPVAMKPYLSHPPWGGLVGSLEVWPADRESTDVRLLSCSFG